MRVFHLSHHDGCIADIDYMAHELGLEVVAARFDDGYNIGPERADRAWARYRDAFEAADAVLVSDTTPLARIVLQHLDEFSGHLIIWICNRFDYGDVATNDCAFPDPAYYELFRQATRHPRVHVIAYTAFEHVWARRAGIDTGSTVIRPLGRQLAHEQPSLLPAGLDRAQTVFVPPYHNDTQLLDLAARCEALGIPAYRGRYGGPSDLVGFQAVVHIPYAWSNFALFEHLQNQLPVFVPSASFLRRLALGGAFFWPQAHLLARHLRVAEWYSPDNDFIVYFRSWRDLRRKMERVDLNGLRELMEVRALLHTRQVLDAWDEVFSSIERARAGRA